MTVTVKDVIKEVRALAKAHPDAVYITEPGDICQYGMGDVVEGDKFVGQGCIVGQALLKLGFEYDPDWEGEGAEGLITTLWQSGKISRLKSDQGAWLDEVQQSQDDGNPWGDAVEVADRNLKDYSTI